MKLILTALLMSSLCSCIDVIAPIEIGGSACNSDGDCPAQFFCRGEPHNRICLRATGALCGNGLIDGVDACDDGNRDDRDACLNNCQIASCGDGHIRTDLSPLMTGYEACDDNNRNDRDACTNFCAWAACGDGIVREDDEVVEACDDGNSDPTDGCTNACEIARCGDGFVRADGIADEACDDGNQINGDGCDADCIHEICGNQRIDDFEECDDGNDDPLDRCTNGCLMARCGDGIHRRDLADDHLDFEECDDGNDASGDGCSVDCLREVCGNRRIDFGEECDDGNTIESDACRNGCLTAYCGDGVVQAEVERCDDANDDDDDLCSSNCRWDFDLIAVPVVLGLPYSVGWRPGSSCRQDYARQHDVVLNHRFEIGRTEVTQAQYLALTNANPSFFRGANRPVDSLGWFEMVNFANLASAADGLDACYEIEPTRDGRGRIIRWPQGYACNGYRLPTESEWEIAARAGTNHLFGNGSDPRQSWNRTNSYAFGSHDVAQLRPNAWGLFDMSGNMREWVWDWEGAYPVGVTVDPIGPNTGRGRIHRGGSWFDDVCWQSVHIRGWERPDNRWDATGFRLARTHFGP